MWNSRMDWQLGLLVVNCFWLLVGMLRHSFLCFRVKLSILNDIWSSLTIQQHAVRKQIKIFFVCQSARGFGLNGVKTAFLYHMYHI